MLPMPSCGRRGGGCLCVWGRLQGLPNPPCWCNHSAHGQTSGVGVSSSPAPSPSTCRRLRRLRRGYPTSPLGPAPLLGARVAPGVPRRTATHAHAYAHKHTIATNPKARTSTHTHRDASIRCGTLHSVPDDMPLHTLSHTSPGQTSPCGWLCGSCRVP